MEDSRDARFGAGLTETEVKRLQAILREQCGLVIDLPEAWSRAIELLDLVEMLLQVHGVESPSTSDPQGSRSVALDQRGIWGIDE